MRTPSGFITIVLSLSIALPAQTPISTEAALTERERVLLDRIGLLEKRLEAVEAKLPSAPSPATAPAPAAASPHEQRSATGDALSLPGFTPGTTMNVLLDGYYEYNFNHPVGRVNLLRPYDPASNNFT